MRQWITKVFHANTRSTLYKMPWCNLHVVSVIYTILFNLGQWVDVFHNHDTVLFIVTAVYTVITFGLCESYLYYIISNAHRHANRTQTKSILIAMAVVVVLVAIDLAWWWARW